MSMNKVYSRPIAWLNKTFVQCGIKSTDSAAKARAIRISNYMAITAVFNTLAFGCLFLVLGDHQLFTTSVSVSAFYAAAYLLNFFGYPTLGRQVILIAGSYFVFYYAAIFRGESYIQLLLYSLSVMPFMYFSWEERKNYILTAPPIIFLMVGEFYQWNFFTANTMGYDLRFVRVFAMAAPMHQILAGFFYFLKQAVKYEAQSKENFRLLEIEHRNQLQVQKMSSLGEMAAGISHEINNPLMVIIGKAYNIKRNLESKATKDEYTSTAVDKIEEMVQRIAKIIKALRNFSRNSEHDPSELAEVASIVNSTLDLCRERFASNGITLELKIDENLHLLCRPTEISQVLLNLLSNAYDATTEVSNPQVTIRARAVQDKIEIIMEDNGPGISPEVAEKIMQPFFTTKEVGKGTGLGLSISKGLIESHHGTLEYVPGAQKTTFKIVLPRAL